MAAEGERIVTFQYFDFIHYYFQIISPTIFKTLLFLHQFFFLFYFFFVGFFGCFVLELGLGLAENAAQSSVISQTC